MSVTFNGIFREHGNDSFAQKAVNSTPFFLQAWVINLVRRGQSFIMIIKTQGVYHDGSAAILAAIKCRLEACAPGKDCVSP